MRDWCKWEGLFCKQEGGRKKLIDFEKLEQLFGKSLVGKTRAKKGDNSLGYNKEREINNIVFDVYFCLNLPFDKRKWIKSCRLKVDNKFGRRGASEMIYYPGVIL